MRRAKNFFRKDLKDYFNQVLTPVLGGVTYLIQMGIVLGGTTYLFKTGVAL